MGKQASSFLSSLRQYHCCALICVTETKKVEQLQPLIAETTYAKLQLSFTVVLPARKIIKGPVLLAENEDVHYQSMQLSETVEYSQKF